MEEKYTCSDCGSENIRPFDSGDNKVRCESCAVKFRNAIQFSLLTQRVPDAGDSASFLNLFYPIYNLLNQARRNPPPRW